MADIFDTLDEPQKKVSGDIFDQLEGGSAAPTVAPDANAPLEQRLANARKKLAAKNPDLFKDDARQVRERQSISGEISGGLQDFGRGLKTAFVGDPNDPGMTFVERLLHGVKGVTLGPLRTAAPILTLGASPYASNIAASAGETVADALAKRGYTTLADITGALTQAGVDAAGSSLGTKAFQKATGKGTITDTLAGKYKTKGERVAELEKQKLADEAKVNTAANIETGKVRRAVADTEGATKAAISSEESIGEAAKDYARQQAGSTRAVTRDNFNLPTQSSEATGQRLAGEYTDKLAASQNKFRKGYKAVTDEAAATKATTANYEKAATEVYGEGAGVSRPLPTKAEGVANKAVNALDAEEGAATQIENLTAEAKAATDPLLRARAEDQLKQLGKSQLPENPTVADLIQERQRLAGAERAAYQSGNDNLYRQFNKLKDGVDADIKAASPSLHQKLGGLNADYAENHIPFFGSKSEIRKAFSKGPEAVVDSLVPKFKDADRVAKLDRLQRFVDDPGNQKMLGDSFARNLIDDATDLQGNLDLGKAVSKWMQYADPRTGDKVLKGVLGDRYQPMRDLLTASQSSPATDVQKTLERTVKEINKTTALRTGSFQKAQTERMKTLGGLLDEGPTFVNGIKAEGKTGSINAGRAEQLKQLQTEFDKKVAAMNKDKLPEHAGQLVGGAAMLHGAVGLLMGSGAAVPQIVTGGIVMLGAPAMFKLINNVKGLELLSRSIRAIPGTTAAAVNARKISQYLKEDGRDAKNTK